MAGQCKDSDGVSITIAPVNDEQAITTNAGAAVAEGSTGTVVVSAMLETSDVDHTPAQLLYTLTDDPQNGTLYRNAVALSVLDTFSQADINAGLMTYSHNGSETQSDAFSVSVDDGLGSTSLAVFNFTVTALNDNQPIITSNGGGPTASISVAENSTAVTTVIATDADLPVQVLTYTITGGADSGLFSIDASTGDLTFVTSPDFEVPTDAGSDNVYNVVVSASDGTFADTQAITVTVLALNDNQPIISSNGGGPTASISVAENSTAVTTVIATDADLPAQVLTYTITGGADSGLFSIDASTGELTFVTSPDFEVPTDAGNDNVYNVVVSVSDGTFADAQAITVTVLALNDNQPIITSNGGGPTASISVAENSTAVTTVIATDADLPTQVLIYSITGGADSGLFSIDASTGDLTFVTSPDFETPTDADSDNVYNVVVSASDGTFADTQAITVTVTALNDNQPIITSNGGGPTASISVAENSTAVTTVIATDADLPVQVLTYTITGGADSGLFSIDASTGDLTFVTSPDFEVPTDAGSDNVYNVVVSASDGTFADTQAITVTVLALNDNQPIISSNGGGPTASISVAENSTAVTTVIATDADLPAQVLTYTITGGADSGLFSIDASTGELTFVTSPDFEVPTDAGNDNVYNVVVSVSDGTFADAQAITVTVLALNDNQPIITSNGGGPTASISVAENSTAVTTVIATDADLPVQVLTYTITGGADAGLFSINALTGDLTFITAPDFEVPADAGSDNVYNVVVSVSDGTFADTQAITVTVTALNDNQPIISSNGGGPTASISVAENSAAVTTVIATDADLPAQVLTYTITGGADSGLFSIDASTGELTFVTSPDFEVPADAGSDNVYNVVVSVSDGTFADTQAITVTVTALNDNQPIITSNGGGPTASISVAENSTAVTTVIATDADLPAQVLTYTITGGADAGLFSINALTGDLTFVTAPDFESPGDAGSNNVYEVVIESFDGPGSSTTQLISVTVTEVNEFAISMVNDLNGAANIVMENTTVGSAVGITAFASDADATVNIVGYTLDDSAGGRFLIDNTTGVVTVFGSLDFETAASHSIMVRATSEDGSFSTQQFTIMIADVNEFSVTLPVDSNATLNSIAENAAIGTQVGVTAAALDADGTTNTILYTLQNNDGGRFSINSTTGVVAVAGAINRETDGSSRLITVRAISADGTFAETDFWIAISDVNEFSVTAITDINAGLNTLAENAASGTTVGITASASDADATNGTITYSLDDSAGGRFSIDTLNGTVSVADGAFLDYESAISQTIVVRATSADASFSIRTFTIALTDVNEFAVSPITNSQFGPVAILENALSGASVGFTASAFDADATLSLITYSLDNDAAGRFRIDSVTGAVAVEDGSQLDRESDEFHTIIIRAASMDGTFSTLTVDVHLIDVDEFDISPMVDINATVNLVAELSLQGTLTGITVAAQDQDATINAISYLLDDDAGGRFQIDNVTGVITAGATLLDYEMASSHVITVRAVSADGSASTLTLTINLIDVDEFDLSSIIDTDPGNSDIPENAAIGTLVGITASAMDLDATNSAVVYSLDDNAGGRFQISSTTGVITVADSNLLDFEQASTHTIQVRATSLDGSISVCSFTIGLINENESPVFAGPALLNVNENSANGIMIGVVSASDPDAGDPLNYSILSSSSPSLFEIDTLTGQLRVINSSQLNFELLTSVTLMIQVSDVAGLTDLQVVSVAINNVNEAPSGLFLTGGVIPENPAAGTLAGIIAGIDPDNSDVLSYSLTNNAGGSLAIDSVTGHVTVVSASRFDYESAGTHSFAVRMTDQAGLYFERSFFITLTDVNDAPAATGEHFSTLQLMPLQIEVFDLLRNDGDADGDGLQLFMVSGPVYGSISHEADGSFTYVPNDLFVGIDSFTYCVNDGQMDSNIVTITIDVQQSISSGDGFEGHSGGSSEVDTAETNREIFLTTGEVAHNTLNIETRDDQSVVVSEMDHERHGSGQTARSTGEWHDTHIEIDSLLNELAADVLSRTMQLADGSIDAERTGVRHLNRDLFTAVARSRSTLWGDWDALISSDECAMPGMVFSMGRVASVNQQSGRGLPPEEMDKIVVGSTALVSTSLSVGYAIWIFRGNSLIAAFLSTTPVWSSFDPLPILQSFDKEKHPEDEESLLSIATARVFNRMPLVPHRPTSGLQL